MAAIEISVGKIGKISFADGAQRAQSHHGAKLNQNHSIVEILQFLRITIPTFVKISQSVAEI